ncbi:hypothetical protein SMC26_15835 [Actinomadura fulvescens]|uniref:Uncharacterized protein n=1 Tax=Actinomadura fulvescens TaxID=46160 RepID=A0ABP6D6B3_9ACTN
MPILHRGQRPARPGAAPAARSSLTGQAWPIALTLGAVIVFVIFLVQATFALALLMAMATLLAGAILLTLVSGTAWISRLGELLADLRRRH